MFKRLHLSNFRGFENVEIDQLRQINLITGKNNAGKSTLLEAIFLLGGGGKSSIGAQRQPNPHPGPGGNTSIDMANVMDTAFL